MNTEEASGVSEGAQEDPRCLHPVSKPVADAKNPLGWPGTSSLFQGNFLPKHLPQAD